MTSGPRRSPRRVLALLAVSAIAAVVLVAVALASRDRAARLPVAPGVAGSVLHPVAGAFEPDGTAVEDCAEADTRCLEQAFGNVAFASGPAEALAAFDARLEAKPDFSRTCHSIVHVIGSAALAREGGDIAKAFAKGSSTCASGYYHGILERAFVGVGSTSELAARARGLCATRGFRPFGYLQRQCNHGLGHGLMLQAGYHLPTALSVCSSLATRWDTLACTNGVFMENADTRFGFRSPWLDDEDPLFPCVEVSGLARRHCYARVPTFALRMYGNSVAKAVETCAGLSLPWSRYCFRGLGRDTIDLESPTSALESCGQAGAGEADCLFGAARLLADRRGPPTAKQLCEAVLGAARGACFIGIGGAIGLVRATDEARARGCAELLAPADAPASLRGARAEVDPRADPWAWG